MRASYALVGCFSGNVLQYTKGPHIFTISEHSTISLIIQCKVMT
uniref:Uncharacterized protein n=1 Tax=Anguilla anguilla TaxID=7936 RepID=A0A0E9PJB1_ANGAN